MKKAAIIGVDPAKNVFQLHGAAGDGSVVFRKKPTRFQFHRFMADHPACTIGMEACGSAHHWAREMAGMGHSPRLTAPKYVKPFVKRQKDDSADAEAIVEAALRPTMRFVEVKSLADQARAVLFRTRAQLIRQRAEAANALRAHLDGFGFIAPLGIAQVKRLAEIIGTDADRIPAAVRPACGELLTSIAQLADRIAALDKAIALRSGEGVTARRLQTMPGVGPIAALAVATFTPTMARFRSGRDFAAWRGLVPLPRSTGGRQILGRTSKMGRRDIGRLLISGAMSVVQAACRKGAPPGSWLGACWRESRRCSWPSHWPTGWPAASGR